MVFNSSADDDRLTIQKILNDASCTDRLVFVDEGSEVIARNIYVQAISDDPVRLKSAMDLIPAKLAEGKQALFRVRPEVMTEKDFERDKVFLRGAVRFSYFDTPGEWKDCDHTVSLHYVG